jgi:phosphoglycerate dehydrogenase-like enzyme
MKLLLHYAAGPNFRAMLSELPAGMTATIVEPGDDAALARELADTDVLLHVLAPVTAAMIEAAPRLKLIQKIGVGVDAIDRGHAAAKGVAVCNMPGTNTAAVSELTLGLMFACLRRLPYLAAQVATPAGWRDSGATGDGLGEIGGRTVGLVGYGAVPQRLAPVLRALGADVIISNRTAHEGDVTFLPLDDLLARSDIVSLHIPATAETTNLLNAGRIARMKPGAILINTARGSLADETALAEALRSGHIAAAGLDVFASEPPSPDNPLLNLPNVVATPHVAWLTRETLRRSLDVAVENARRVADGSSLLHRI